jgi:predicted alpha/beta superfamily hydrolase
VLQKWILAGLLVLNAWTVLGQEYQIKHEVVRSHQLGTNRTIHVYLPASYKKEAGRRYPVLYLHDGQNIFSTAGTNCAFGWGSWQLDKTADGLARAQKMQEVIMVAVDNSDARIEEYAGRLSLPRTNAATAGGKTAFENYAAFLITELKPQIDREYRTKPGPANTGLMGSSLGGIGSVVLAWEHPEIFGRAACLSGSFQIEHTNFLNEVLHNYQGKPKPVWIYLDSGTVDFTGGDDNRALTAQVAAELRRIGWENDLMLSVDEQPLTPEEMENAGLRRDKWAEAQTSQHNEFYWRLRAWRALTFLFPPDKK